MQVSFTIYPAGEDERTYVTTMPQVPSVGDSVHLGDDDIAIMRVTHVTWVRGEVAGTEVWAVECSAR